MSSLMTALEPIAATSKGNDDQIVLTIWFESANLRVSRVLDAIRELKQRWLPVTHKDTRFEDVYSSVDLVGPQADIRKIVSAIGSPPARLVACKVDPKKGEIDFFLSHGPEFTQADKDKLLREGFGICPIFAVKLFRSDVLRVETHGSDEKEIRAFAKLLNAAVWTGAPASWLNA